MNPTELAIAKISGLLLSKSAVSFFINGGPGTGKSYLASELAKDIPAAIPGAFIIGPNVVLASDFDNLPISQMQACFQAGFLDAVPPEDELRNVADAWIWLDHQNLFSSRQVFVVLVELGSDLSLASIAELFSRIRHLEAAWNGSGARLLYLVIGSWDVVALTQYYEENGVSFPYTIGRNYMIWKGISSDAMYSLMQREIPSSMPIHGRVLHELCGGNPTVALEILRGLQGQDISVENLLDATRQVATDGETGCRWIEQWTQLTSDAKAIVKELLHQRCTTNSCSSEPVNQLVALGIVKQRRIGTERYLLFRSWYMELLFRLHLASLGMDETRLAEVQIEEMVPSILSVNQEAYETIHEIENNVRDFVALWLSMHDTQPEHILVGKVEKYVNEIDDTEDLFDRAAHWRLRSEIAGLPKNLNPLLAYCSTRDLAALVVEVGRLLSSDAWQQIADLLERLAYIRDAVMHNQLIGDEQIRKLNELQRAVYRALAQAK